MALGAHPLSLIVAHEEPASEAVADMELLLEDVAAKIAQLGLEAGGGHPPAHLVDDEGFDFPEVEDLANASFAMGSGGLNLPILTSGIDYLTAESAGEQLAPPAGGQHGDAAGEVYHNVSELEALFGAANLSVGITAVIGNLDGSDPIECHDIAYYTPDVRDCVADLS